MAAANTTDEIFRIIFPGKALEFTGERMTTAIEGQIEFEHFHRYCLARDLCQGLDVLDVASGEGYGSAILAGIARSVIGVDIDAGSVAHAQESYRAENLRFLQGGALDLPLDDGSVDVVVSFETLEHLREHARFVAEVRRVLRPGGLLIVSTPDRTVYSARGEHFNEFHLLELAEPEFGSFLRANFANAIMLSQRSMLGSVIAAPEGGDPWRSYERRVPEYIEASSGLARAPYLIGLASDAALPPVHSSAYIDRRSADEVVRDFMRVPGLEARAVERERERDAARGSLAEAEGRAAERERERDAARGSLAEAEGRAAERERERDAARGSLAEAEGRAAERERERDAARGSLAEAEGRAAERERERDAARGSLAEAEGRAAERERERDAARGSLAEAEGRAAERERERDAARAALAEAGDAAYAVRASLQSQVLRLSEHSDHLAWELARAYNRPWRPIKHFINYYSLAALSAVSASFSARTAARFARSVQKRSPGRFDKFLGANRDAAESGVNPLLHTAGAPLTANTTEGREPSTPPGSPTPHPVKQEPSLWYYIGDTLDWLDAHSQLTGVGRVSTELFFASRRNSGETKVWPCIFGQSPSRLVEMTDAERLRFLAQKTGLAVDEAMVEDFGPSIPHARGPESGDHVFFTGLVWTPTFTDLFKHLARQKINFSVLVYDIIPVESPDVVGDEYFRSFSDWLVTTLNTANVICVSNNFVKDQIVRWALLTGVEIKAQIVLIPFGLRQIASALSPSELASRPQTAKVDLEGFVLSVGTIDKRKNQIFLCSIWKKLADRLGLDKIPQLVLVGRDDIGIDTVDLTLSALFAEGKILVLQGLSDPDVAGLYKSCLFTAFSSMSEGYGLPVAESLLYGKLCLSSDLPTIREHAHDLVWYFDPDDIGEAVGLFIRAIDGPKERKEAETRILRDFRPTKWGDTFRTILTVAQSSLRERVFSLESEAPIPAFPGARAVEPNQALANARRWCSSDDPVVSILIVNWNAAALTRECIRQVWANTEGDTYEIVIADNGSSREDVDKLRKLGRGVRLLDLGCNRFFGEANNIAAEASHGRFLCMLNNDASVQPGWLTALIEPFAADPQIGATGPLFFFPDWTIQEAGGVLDAGGYPVRLGRGDKQPSPEILKPRFVDYISAAALLISRDVFMEAGGYDLAYEPAYYEDADLCLKIQAFGRKIRYCPESRVIHIEGLSANGDTLSEARRKALGDLNRDKFVARWGRYLRTRDPNELTVFRSSFARPRPADEPAAQTDKERTAAVYTPYALTPGGGERYLLTLAALLARNYVVTVVTPHPYSLLRFRNLGQEFSIDLSRLRTSTEAAFAEAPSPDLMVTMGNHVIPPIPARGSVNIFLCQFPFPMSEQPNPIDRAVLANYDTVLVYSQYTAAHFYAALNALQLPQIALRIVNPPVQLITGDCAKKQRTILSVGRFFVGGHSKRHDALISSFKSICDKFEEPVELHLAGSSTPAGEDMDYLASLKASAEGYPIHFHVNCSASELHSLYRDAFVYWHGAGIGANLSAEPEKAEHFGISIVEAMSAQAIPFALNSGGPREIIDDGETGFLYDSVETMMSLTLGIFSKAERPRANRIMRAAGLRAYDFSTENFERAIEALVKELAMTT